MTTQSNPLQDLFRKPKFFIKLPSKFKYYDKSIFKFVSANEEIGVCSLTAQDEIMFKNPDALMNGYAIINALKSCVGVENPEILTIHDSEIILLAIKGATYGDINEFDSECPKCKTNHSFKTSCRTILESVQFDDIDGIIEMPNFKIEIMPHTQNSATKQALMLFEQAKMQNMLQNEAGSKSTEEIAKYLGGTILSLAKFKEDLVVESIKYIESNKTVVTDKNHIREFIQNCDAKIIELIDNKIKSINNMDNLSMDAVCKNEECKHEWKIGLGFNPSSFFEQGS